MTDKNRTQPALAWGLLVLLVVVAMALIVVPALSARQQYLQQSEQNLFIKQKLLQSLATEQKTPTELNRQQPGDLLFPSRPEALLAAEIQTIISRLVEQQAGDLISVQTAEQEQVDTLGKVSLMVHLRADTASLIALLDTLSAHQPMLIVEEPQIHVRVLKAKQADELEQQTILDVRFKLSGFYQQTEDSEA